MKKYQSSYVLKQIKKKRIFEKKIHMDFPSNLTPVDHLRMLVTSIVVTNSKLLNLLCKAGGVINFAKQFPNFTVGTLNWSKNIVVV